MHKIRSITMSLKKNLMFFLPVLYLSMAVNSAVTASGPTIEEVDDSSDVSPLTHQTSAESNQNHQDAQPSSTGEADTVEQFLTIVGMLNRATGFNVMDLLSFKGDMSLNMINITDSLGRDNFGKERGTLGHMLAAKNDPNSALLFNRFIGLALQNYHFIWKQEQESGTAETSASNMIPKACIDAFWQEFLQKRNAYNNTICHVAAENGSRWFFWIGKKWGMPDSALVVNGPSNNTILHSAISSGMNPEVKITMVRYLSGILKENNYLKTVLEQRTSANLTPKDIAGQLRLRHIAAYLNDLKAKEDSAAAATS